MSSRMQHEEHIWDGVIYKKRMTYYPAGTNAISAQATYAAGAKTQHTSADHGLSTGDPITIAGTTSYNGDVVVDEIIDKDNFITAQSFVADEGGTWAYDSDIQGKIQYQGRAYPEILESEDAWEIRKYQYDQAGKLLAELFGAKLLTDKPTNRFVYIWDQRASLFYF